MTIPRVGVKNIFSSKREWDGEPVLFPKLLSVSAKLIAFRKTGTLHDAETKACLISCHPKYSGG
jgi:hypothetical protein